jgi:hepatocyte growth factor-regulated tyrosine kinase substrate
MQPRSARVDDGFDEDLKRALAMSLEEVNGHSGAGYVPQAKIQSPKPATNGTTKPSATKPAEEEDDDLKAAIAASLADMEEQKKKHAATIKEQAGAKTSGAFVLPKNDYELTPVEAENINLFSTLVDRLQTQPPGTILREPQIQELYESINKLRPKLARTYGETMSKHGKFPDMYFGCLLTSADALLDLHAKLSTVVRYYDRMLEERLSNTYSQHTIGGYNLPPQRPASTMYPSIASNGPAATGTAESFYTGNGQPEAYGRPQSTYAAYGAPPQQYQQYDNRRASIASPGLPASQQPSEPYNQYPPQQAPQQKPAQSQRTVSWQTPDPAAPQYASQAPSYPPENAPPTQQQAAPPTNPQQQAPPMNAPSQPPASYGPSEPVMTPSADPNAAFYYNNAAPVPQTQQAPEPNSQQYPPAHQSPQQYHTTIPQPVSPQMYARQPQKPQEQYAPPPQQQVAPPQQAPAQQQAHPPQQQRQQASYWPPQQVPQQVPQQQWQAPPQTYTGYTQDSFPSAPHHTPQVKVEESLIDL